MAAKSVKDTLFGAEENSAAKLDPEKRSRFQRIAAQMYHTPQLSAREVGIPAIAQAGRQVGEMLTGTYATYFYVSVLRLDMVYVTIILTLTGIFNTLVRPLMGIAYDKTRTRWGKARPFTLFAPVFYFACTALLFCGRLFFDNDVTDDPRKILFVFTMLIMKDTFSLIYKVPTDNYTSLMSPNPKDRISVGLWESYSKKWSGDFLAAMIMPLLDLARSGYLNVSPGAIFACFGLLGTVFGVGGNLLMAASCPERIILQPKPAATTKSLFYILKNKYLLRKFVADMASSWWSNGGYSWDVVTQMEIFGGVIRTIPWYLPRNIFNFVSIAFVEPFKKLFGGNFRKTILFMRTWDFIFGIIQATLAISTKSVNTWWKAGLIFAIFDGLKVSNDAPSTVMEGEINREITDYTEYMTGERPDGSIGILTDLIRKATEPLKALMSIAMLKWVNYDPNIGANRRWSQDTVRANSTMYTRVFFLYTLSNVPGFIFGLIPMIFYDLEGQKKRDVYAALNERRALIAKQDALSKEMEAMLGMMAEEEAAERQEEAITVKGGK